jgi:lipopolysaccharide/colanic/teichoic acid biosynthesis glycosyltransferase
MKMSKRLFQKEPYYFLKVLLDGFLLTAAFFTVYLLKRGSFYHDRFPGLEPNFATFFPVLIITWLLVTLFSKKFTILKETGYFKGLTPYLLSVFALTALINVILYAAGWYHLSRIIVFGSIALFFAFELLVFSLRYVLFFPSENRENENWLPMSFFLTEFFLLIFSFIAIHYYKKKDFTPRDEYLLFLMGVIFLWVVVSFIVHRFEIPAGRSYFRTLFPFLKSQLVIIGLVSIAVVLAKLVFFSRTVILGTLIVFALLEHLAVTIYFLATRGEETDETRPGLFHAEPLEEEPPRLADICEELPGKKYEFPGAEASKLLLREKLKNAYLSKFQPVFQFIDRRLDLETLDILNSHVIYSSNPYNIEILEDRSLHFFANLRELNDFRRINKYLVRLNEKMQTGGVLVGKFQDLAQKRERLYKKFPFVFARMFYPLYFLYKRVFPKLPVLQKIYFLFSRGRKRALSKAEALGRIYFCGFEIIDLKEIDDFTWFIAKKVRSPERDRKPSYGLFFKQKRIGKGGKTIYMYKIRTMHPYSEYIHKYVLENYELDESGKIKDDFRITKWGKVFRRLWIDEIPMLVNWLKRDIKLVGVRPLSRSFFSTYPEALKKERIEFKPGLIPPYYADMPNGMDEVWKSEKNYLERYQKSPLKTDCFYFFKALKNILFHHAKSQ